MQDINKRNNPRTVNALDRYANQISQNDIVRVTGPSYPPEGACGMRRVMKLLWEVLWDSTIFHIAVYLHWMENAPNPLRFLRQIN